MRTVKIDNVLLTEEQIRNAVRELDMPTLESLHLRHVSRFVSEKFERGVIITGYVQQAYARGNELSDYVGGITVVFTDPKNNNACSFRSVTSFLASNWSLDE